MKKMRQINVDDALSFHVFRELDMSWEWRCGCSSLELAEADIQHSVHETLNVYASNRFDESDFAIVGLPWLLEDDAKTEEVFLDYEIDGKPVYY